MTLSEQVQTIYNHIRKEHVGRYAGTGKVYSHQVTAGQALYFAKRQAEILQSWATYDAMGLVRLRTENDDDWTEDSLFGETFDPKVTGLSPRTMARQKAEELDRVHREGVYGIISEYRPDRDSEWIQADSCWGFIGDDWKESGYDLDAKAAACEALDDITQRVSIACAHE